MSPPTFIAQIQLLLVASVFTLSPMTASAQSPADTQQIIRTAERPTIDTVLASLEAGNGLNLGDYLALFDHYRALWSEGKTDSTFLVSLAKWDKKLAESFLLFARQPDTTDLRRKAYTHYAVNCTRRLGTLPPPGARQLAIAYADDMGVQLEDRLLPSPRDRGANGLKQAGIYINRLAYNRDDVLPIESFPKKATKTYLLPNAMWMSQLANWAYESESASRKQLKRWGFNNAEFQWFDERGSDSQFFIATQRDAVYLVFRGTTSFTDMVTDLKLYKSAETGGGNVHAGFKSAMDVIWSPHILPAISQTLKGRKLIVVGHSLGGALAQLAAYRLQRAGHPVTAVYTYGSPYVGDPTFVKAYDALLGDRTYNHINHNDVVAYSPPWWMGFRLTAAPNARRFLGRDHEMGGVDAEAEQQRDPRPDGVKMGQHGLIEMNDAAREHLQSQLAHADATIQNATQKLTSAPDAMDSVAYGTDFADNRFDEHRASQYTYKLGCAIVDALWKDEVRKARASRRR